MFQDCNTFLMSMPSCPFSVNEPQAKESDSPHDCKYFGHFSPEWHSFFCPVKENSPILSLFYPLEQTKRDFQKNLTVVGQEYCSYQEEAVHISKLEHQPHYNAGAAIPVLSDNAFRAVTRASLAPVQLLPNDLIVVGVTGSNLRILGKVHLMFQLEEKVYSFNTVFYVTTNSELPVDGLLGIETMNKLHMVINTNSNTVTYQGQQMRAMDEPTPMAPSVPQRHEFSTDKTTVSSSWSCNSYYIIKSVAGILP